MSKDAVKENALSTRQACEEFGIGQRGYWYDPKLSGENGFVADGLVRLTTNQSNWGSGSVPWVQNYGVYVAMPNACPFCKNNISQKILYQNELAYAILDGYPVSEGHHLVIPKKHIPDYFSLTQDEKLSIDSLLMVIRESLLMNDKSITGFNLGINVGESAGQTIFHVHVHIIPRRDGDTPNPRGGVRGVIPTKMSY